jgi:hypothetical protein
MVMVMWQDCFNGFTMLSTKCDSHESWIFLNEFSEKRLKKRLLNKILNLLKKLN